MKSKRILAILLLIAIIFSMFNLNYEVEANTNGYTADTAIDWVKSKLYTTVGSGECVALIMAYELELAGFHSTGSGVDYGYNALPNGWTRIQGGIPQKGDILIYSPTVANEHGHVAIYESEYSTYHQNYGGRIVMQITNRYDQMYDVANNIMPYWGLIRPDFVTDTENPVISSAYVDPTSMTGSSYTVRVSATDNVGISKIPIMTWSIDNGQDDIKEYRANADGVGYSYTIEASNHGNNKGLYNSHVYVYDEVGNGVSVGLNDIPMNSRFVKDLGSFEAKIVLKSNADYVITTSGTENNDNVVLGKKSNSDENQIWKFNQKSDGSYEIVNITTGKVLDITNASDNDGASVAIYDRNDSDAQTFYIMEYNEGYRIVPKCSANLKAINLADANPVEGGEISLYHAGNEDAQTWNFEDISTFIKLNKTSLTITEIGETEQLTASIIPSSVEDKAIIWTSDEESVATVDSTGLVTAIGFGTATITATTSDGDYHATCEVKVNCGHKNITTHEAVASTCLEQGHGEYVTCDDCGEIISGSDDLLPLADHHYGELIERVEPVHTTSTLEDGMEAHYECSVCGKLFNENKEEVTEEDLIIKAPLHEYGDWVANTENHWKECGCGNIIELEAHKGGEATCSKKAVCEICNLEYGEINPNNHKNTETRNEAEATTEKEGYTGDIYCLDCGKLVKKGEIIPVIKDEEDKPIEETKPEEDKPADETKPEEDKPTEENKPVEEETQPINNAEKEETIDVNKPQTGDDSNIILWISLLVISGISFVIIVRCNTKRRISKHSK